MMVRIRSAYTVEEDVCIAEALLNEGLTFKGRGLKLLRTRLTEVYDRFITYVARYGIDGRQRSPRSLEARVYLLQEAYRERRLNKRVDYNNPLAANRSELWTSIFRGTAISRSAPSAEFHAQRRQPQGLEQAPASMVYPKPLMSHQPLEGGIRKQRHEHAKMLLHALNSLNRERMQSSLKREENLRRQQLVEQSERRWKMDRFNQLLKKSPSNDDACIDFLKTLEDMSSRDARLSIQREESAQERLENDREVREWERNAFEELMNQYFDEDM